MKLTIISQNGRVLPTIPSRILSQGSYFFWTSCWIFKLVVKKLLSNSEENKFCTMINLTKRIGIISRQYFLVCFYCDFCGLFFAIPCAHDALTVLNLFPYLCFWFITWHNSDQHHPFPFHPQLLLPHRVPVSINNAIRCKGRSGIVVQAHLASFFC